MLTLIIRAIIIYLLVLVLYRLMGKRQIGQMQPFELVLTLIIADLATLPMAEISVPSLNGIVPLVTLVIVHFLLTFFSKKSSTFGKILSGKPVIIIDPNGIDVDAINKLDLTVEDVMEAIRGQGYFKLEEVQYAIMETSGTVNVMPKIASSPVTVKDLELTVEENSLPYTIISEGNIMKENLPLANLTEEQVKNILKNKKIKKQKDVVIFTVDTFGNCYFQTKKNPFESFSIKKVLTNE